MSEGSWEQRAHIEHLRANDAEKEMEFAQACNEELQAIVKEMERKNRRAYEDGYKMGYGIAVTEKKAMESLIAKQQEVREVRDDESPKGDRPSNIPTCEVWQKDRPEKPYQWMDRGKLIKLMDYVLDRGLISVRKLCAIMDCNIEDITNDM